jgi:hypothetical protein
MTVSVPNKMQLLEQLVGSSTLVDKGPYDLEFISGACFKSLGVMEDKFRVPFEYISWLLML